MQGLSIKNGNSFGIMYLGLNVIYCKSLTALRISECIAGFATRI
jgi:hypothetical protein